MEQPNRLVGFILEIRKPLLLLGFGVFVSTVLFYFATPYVLALMQGHLDQKLSFFTVAEPFLSHVRLALSLALFSLMPLIAAFFWRAVGKSFEFSRKSLFLFVIFTCLLFYGGSSFCYFVTLPFGVKFLLGFQSEQLQPVIAIGRFVTFVTVFILAFGIIFELPILMVFAAKAKIIARQQFEKNRRYALLAISIIAALLTPTPDVVNMLLMGGPLYLLYELGIVLLKFLRI